MKVPEEPSSVIFLLKLDDEFAISRLTKFKKGEVLLMKDWKKKCILFLVSQNISLFGSSIVGYAITWYITLKTSSGMWMTASILCSLLPQLFISLFAGVWADRYNRKVLIMASDGFIAASTLGLAVMFMLGKDSMWLLMFVSAVRSVGAGIQTPAVGALVPQIIPQEHLTRINGINQTCNSVLMMISPAVGGVLLGSVGVAWAMLADVTTAALGISVMFFVKVEKPESKDSVSMWKELKEGISYTKGHPVVSRILLYYGIAFFLITPAAFLSPLMIERSFGSEVWRLSANEIVWTVGSLAGGLFVAWKGNFKDKWRVMAVSYIGFGITFLLLGLSPAFWIYLAFMFAAGIFMPPLATASTVMLQEEVEGSKLGRVFSVFQIISGSVMPLGMLIFGPMADYVRIQWIMVGSGALLAVTGGFVGKKKISHQL